MLQARKRRNPAATTPNPLEPMACSSPNRVDPDDPAVTALRSTLSRDRLALVENEPAAKAGEEKGVHQLRTTTRRLRTALDILAELTDADRVSGLADDLKWLAHVLGEVRDLDVLKTRLRQTAESDGLAEPLAPLFEALDARHAQVSSALREAMATDRYRGLEGRLSDLIADLSAAGAKGEPRRSVLPAMVLGPWKRLKRGARSLAPDSPDDDFHEVRKRAKRVRYAAEAIVPALDEKAAAEARRFIQRARHVQDVLGAHQDAVIAMAEIEKQAMAHPDLGPFNFAAGRLRELEHQQADRARDDFFPAWNALDHKKRARWLRR